MFVWMDIIGSPPSFESKLCDKMNITPSHGIEWKGRVLFHIAVVDTKEPVMKMDKIIEKVKEDSDHFVKE